MNAVSPGVPCCLPGGTSTTWECAEGTRSFSPTLVSQTTWPWLGESVDQLPVAPQHSLFRLCHPIKLELWIPPPPGGTSTPWECAEGTRSLSTTLVSQTTWPWLGESVDQLPVAPQHSLFRLCHPIKLELWIPPPPGGTSTPWECAEGTRSLSTTLVSQTGMALTGHVQRSASCCFATQPFQAVPPRAAFEQ